MLKLSVNIQNKTEEKIDSLLIKNSVLELLKNKNIKGKIELSVILVSKQEILKINQKYRQKDKPACVLSFPLHSRVSKTKLPYNNVSAPLLLGDIVICPEEIYQESGNNNPKKIKFFIQHGLLHLLGIHH